MGVRDHSVFKVVAMGTIDERVQTAYMESERTGRKLPHTIVDHVVAETPALAKAWAESGSRPFRMNDYRVESVEEVAKLSAIITTEIY